MFVELIQFPISATAPLIIIMMRRGLDIGTKHWEFLRSFIFMKQLKASRELYNGISENSGIAFKEGRDLIMPRFVGAELYEFIQCEQRGHSIGRVGHIQ